MDNLRDLSYEEMESSIRALGERPYRALQLYRWVFKRGVEDIDEMTDLNKGLRERLKERFYIGATVVLDATGDSRGTQKLLIGLGDGAAIESVLIREDKRTTLCVSTQAGCALGCSFCFTGAGGFLRNLRLSEMCGQVISAKGLLEENERITNIVLMGMGEPLCNLDEVLKFIRVLTDPEGFGFSSRRVTLSTAGLVPEMERLGKSSDIKLAVSLNATTDSVRKRLMPVNRRYPIKELIKALRRYPLKKGRRITIEYVLLKDVNDSEEDARRLVKLLKGIPCKINLIPFNPYPGANFKRPPDEVVLRFQKILVDSHYTAVVRKSGGLEINAACGQLGVRKSQGQKGLTPESGR